MTEKNSLKLKYLLIAGVQPGRIEAGVKECVLFWDREWTRL